MTGTIFRTLLTATVVVAAAGSAGTASADPPTGSYTATVTGTIGEYLKPPVATWVFAPCGADCLDVDAGFVRLHPVNGRWTGTYVVHAVDNGETVTCTRSLGEGLATASDICPKPLGIIVNFALTKIA
jgi:hypothetical protein